MKIVWNEGGRVLYASIMDRLAETGSSWQKNTVITLLSRLVDKGLLTTSKIGRRNEYAAAVTQEQYQAAQTRTLLNKLYRGEAKNLVMTLVQQDLLTEEDYEEVKAFWDAGRNKL